MPAIGDWCAVPIARRDGERSEVAAAHMDPSKREFAWDIERRFPPRLGGGPGPPRSSPRGEREWNPRLPDAMPLEANANDPEHLEAVRALGLRSSIIVPLRRT